MNTIIIEGQSVSKPPHFNGTNYTDWKHQMKIYVQSIDLKLWLVIKNGSKIPKKIIEGKEIEKREDEFDDEETKNMEREAKAKYILYSAINRHALEKVSECQTAKELWDKLDREMAVVVDSTTSEQQLLVASVQYNIPNCDFLDQSREGMSNYFNLCVPLYKLALEGNWPAAKRILDQDKTKRLRHAAITSELFTALHVAAGANCVPFVKELLVLLDDNHIALQDIRGKTAFCYAAEAENWEIVRLLLKINPLLPRIKSENGHTPVQFVALKGRCRMACYLYDKSKPVFEDQDWKLLFFTCIKTGNYHLALKMARENRELAFARDENKETALHILAQTQTPLDSFCQCPKREDPIPINPGMKQHEVFQLVNFLWTTVLHKAGSVSEIIGFISKPSQLLFDAAKIGNFGFLSELISAYPSLKQEVDSKNQSIIHIAVLNRHASIFNLVHEIGPLKDILETYKGAEGKNTLLHLAAKLAPSSQLEFVSGPAFQMWLQLEWFEKVKETVPPSFINLKNSEGLTARELFTREHEELRRNAESWIARIAKFCMLISTFIATVAFSAAISIFSGLSDGTKGPNYSNKTPYLVFTTSNTIACISSTIALFFFLSILMSSYKEYDFYKSLPLKLILGLVMLLISIASLMVAFGSVAFITYNHAWKWAPNFVSVLAGLSTLFFIVLQFPLWSDVIYSTYYCWTLFKQGKRMIYTY